MVEAAPPARAESKAVEPLRTPDFRRLWAANGFRSLAGDVSAFALPVTAALLLGASPLSLGLIAASGNIGYLLLGLPAGVWVDRWDKRTVLVLADLVYFISLLSIPVAYLAGSLGVAHLVVVAAAIGVADVFFSVAHSSILPYLLPKESVADANARLQTTDSSIGAVAPGLAGLLAQSVAAPLLYAIGAGLHLMSMGFLRRIGNSETREVKDVSRRNFLEELKEGVQAIFESALLRLFLMQTTLSNFAIGMLIATANFFILRDIGMAPWLFGLLSSIQAAAAIIASIVCRGLRVRFGEIRMTLVFSWIAPVGVALLALAGVFRSIAPFLVIGWGVVGAFSLVGRSISVAGIRARITRRSLLGRVSAANSTVSMGMVLLGSLTGGVVATTTSTEVVLWIALVVISIPGILILVSPLRSVRRLPKEWEVAD